MKALLRALGLAIALIGMAMPARADVDWLVNGLFADGGAFSGSFSIDQYGLVQNFDVTTTDGSGMSGYHYLYGAADHYNNDHLIILQWGDYTNALSLQFAADLTGPASAGAINSGFECRDSSSCYAGLQTTNGASSRSITSGESDAASSAVPEPASWMTMIAGFGLIGAAMRRGRRQDRAATAIRRA